MNNKTDIRLVNTHTKSYGGYNNLYIFIQKLVLPVGPKLGVKAGMVSNSLNIIGHQYFSQLLSCFTVKRINNTAFVHVLANKAYHTFYGLLFFNLGLYFVIQVGAVKRRNINVGVIKAKVFYNIALHLWCCGSRKGHNSSAWLYLVHHLPQATVLRPEIVPPFRNTMRLIHRKERHGKVAEEFQVFLLCKCFWRDV